ncbi:MAG: EAL domain-containing protein [Lachnospiraceae bacterium]|nr:EAL domain-containing protein [Lachnospiraceae bacterium]
MVRQKEKDFRKLKKGQSWLSVVSFVISYLCFTIVLGAIVVVFFIYMQSTKLNEESSNINQMAELYRLATTTDNEGIMDYLKEEGRSFIVRDVRGKTLFRQGEDTISNRRIYFTGADESIRYNIFADTESVDFFEDQNNSGLKGLVNYFSLHMTEKNAGRGDDEDDDDGIVVESLVIPYWISVYLEDGSSFIGKCNLQVEKEDVVVITTFLLGMMVMLIVIFIGLISGIIRNIGYQTKLTDFFLTDEVTLGNNWMAYLIKGEALLKKMRNAGKRYAVLNLVIVKYRNYCLCHSLEEGELMLRKISKIIDANIQPKRELNAHVSSSSFALLLELTGEDTLKHRITALTEELQKADPEHVFQFQVGVALVEASIHNGKAVMRRNPQLEQLYNNACTARTTLEKADDSGIAFFNKDLVEEQKWINTVQERQQQALEREEFVVYYQPKYSPDESKISGAEALIRWQSPEFGLVAPGRIIPIFENNGFITEIDHYMIRHVARDQKAWLDQGLECVPISVNVSRAHFAEEDLAEQIRDMVDEAGTPHHLIEIELTESAFFDDKNALITTIERLKSYGFSVSMDDFGAGYSSLNSLKDMALDVLKLDAEFFRGDAEQDRKEIVVGEAIRLARSLNMRTVAEGVEEKDQVEFLAQQGCDMIQGFIYAEPMPKEEYEERIREIYHNIE